MKKNQLQILIITLLLIVCVFKSQAQNSVVPYSGTSNIKVCGGTISDYTNATGYSSGANGILVIEPETKGNFIKLFFTTFDLGSCCDYLTIYNGNGVNTDSLIASYSGNNIPKTIFSSAKSGKLTLKFSSSNSYSSLKGFKANVSCVSSLPNTDLKLNSFTLTSLGAIIAGNSITTNASISNNSAINTSAHTLGYFLSTDTIYQKTDIFLTNASIGAITQGATTTLSTSISIPTSITATGDYYLIAYDNYLHTINESDSTNNLKYIKVNITGSNIDLTILNPTLSSNVLAKGGTFTAKLSVLNMGTTTAASNKVSFYISRDKLFDTLDTYVGITQSNSINGNSITSINSTFTTPNTLDTGSYNLLLIVDAINEVTEFNETNNSFIIPIKVDVQRIDLAIDTVLLSVNSIPSGGTLAITTKIRNKGDVIVNLHSTAFYISLDNTYDINDKLITTSSVSTLNPGDVFNSSTNLSIPSNTIAGKYYVIVFEDNTNLYTENNEKNNFVSVPLTIVDAAIDLSIENVVLSQNYVTNNTTITLNYILKNTGNSTTSNFSNYFYLSKDSIYDNQDLSLGSSYLYNILSNTSTNQSVSITIPSGVSIGNYYVIVFADFYNAILETKETNNISSTPILVGNSNTDLSISNINLSKSKTTSGGNTILNYTINNAGNMNIYSSIYTGFYVSTDSIWDNKDISITTNYLSSLYSSKSIQQSQTLTLPSLALGNYYIIAFVDNSNNISESDEKNNQQIIPFSIIAPINDLATSAVNLLTTNFVAGSSIKTSCVLYNNGNTTISSSSIGYYISNDSLLSNDDKYLGAYSTTILDATSSVISNTVTLPNTLNPGNYYLIYKADYQNTIIETDELNNISFQTISVIPSIIDLFITKQSVSKSTISSGSTFVVNSILNNIGNASAINSKVGYYLSQDTIYSKSDVLLYSTSISSLTNNSTVSLQNSVMIPTLLAPGNYYVLFFANYDNSIVELNDSNNVSFVPIIIQSANVDFDLTAPSASPTNVVVGNSIQLSCVLNNRGNFTANSSSVGYYLSSDTILDNKDKLIGNYTGLSIADNSNFKVASTLIINSSTVPGNYYLIFFADYLNNMIESNENNNSQLIPITIVAPTIDLFVSNFNLNPTTVVKGNSISETSLLSSYSNTSISSVTLDFYLSNDTLFDINDNLLSTYNANNINPMVNTSISSSMTISSNITSGKYYVLAVTDRLNAFKETNESNNVSYSKITIVDPAIDLIITNATVSPTSVVSGSSVTVSYTAKNIGNTSSQTSNVGYYLSKDSILDNKDIFITYTSGYNISANGNSSYYDYLDIPTSVVQGNYYLIYFVDYQNVEKEINEKNNTFYNLISIVGPTIDLTLTNASASPTTIASGSSISVSYVLNNLGNATPQTSNVGYYLSKDSVLDSKDLFLKSYNGYGISPNSNNYQYDNITIPSSVAVGNYFLIYFVDYQDIEIESNEKNNTFINLIKVTEPQIDLTITSVYLNNAPIFTKGQIYLSADIQNVGSSSSDSSNIGFYLSKDNTLDQSDTYLGNALNGTLTAYNSTSLYYLGVLPSSIASGDYYLIAFADYNKSIKEINESNNIKSLLINIQPSNEPYHGPDLIVTNSLISSNKVMLGGTLSVSTYIINQGDTMASASSVGFYLSKDTIFDVSDEILSYSIGLKLPADSVSIRSDKNVIIPSNTPLGNYYFLFVADDMNEVNEISEINNVQSIPFQIIEKSTGITEIAENEFNIYPNPTKNNFSLGLKNDLQNIEVEIVSLTGQVLQRHQFTHSSQAENTKFSIDELDFGVYLVNVKTNNQFYSKRIVKIKD